MLATLVVTWQSYGEPSSPWEKRVPPPSTLTGEPARVATVGRILKKKRRINHSVSATDAAILRLKMLRTYEVADGADHVLEVLSRRSVNETSNKNSELGDGGS